MVDSNVEAASVDVAGLEQVVGALIQRCADLQRDNDDLRLSLLDATVEYEQAIKTQELARERVASVISRLKALEE